MFPIEAPSFLPIATDRGARRTSEARAWGSKWRKVVEAPSRMKTSPSRGCVSPTAPWQPRAEQEELPTRRVSEADSRSTRGGIAPIEAGPSVIATRPAIEATRTATIRGVGSDRASGVMDLGSIPRLAAEGSRPRLPDGPRRCKGPSIGLLAKEGVVGPGPARSLRFLDYQS